MASCGTIFSNIILTSTALYSSHKLFKNHRAPSLGFFLLGFSAGLSTLTSFTPYFSSLQEEVSWAADVLAPVLVSFEFLWLSEDHNTAYVVLCGSCLFLGLSNWLSADAFAVMTHCLFLSSLSCCLTVCLFAGNALGAVAGVALTVPLLMASTAVELMQWILKGFLCVGCWAATQALNIFLIDVTDRCHISI